MAAYKTGAFVRSKYYTPFQKTLLKWIPRSKSGASKSRPHWAAHTRTGNVWEYPPPPGPMSIKNHLLAKQNRSSRQSRCVATSYLYVHYFKNMIQVIYHGKYVNHVLLYLPRKDHVNNQ